MGVAGRGCDIGGQVFNSKDFTRLLLQKPSKDRQSFLGATMRGRFRKNTHVTNVANPNGMGRPCRLKDQTTEYLPASYRLSGSH
jgi:hypothetical protein